MIREGAESPSTGAIRLEPLIEQGSLTGDERKLITVPSVAGNFAIHGRSY